MRKLKITIAFVALILLFSSTAFAQSQNDSDTYIKLYEDSGADDLKENLPDEAKGYLHDLGIDDADFNSIFKADPKSIIKLFYEIACRKIDEPLKAFIKITGLLFLTSVIKILMPSTDKLNNAVNITLSCAVILLVISPVLETLTRGVTAIESSCIFMKSLIPVFTGIIAMSGNPMLALSYNSLTLFMAQGVSAICKNTVVPLSGAYTALCAVSGISSELNLKGITDFLKKTAITTLSVVATLFSAALSLQGLMAGAADNLASRGIKLAISTAVPVVGGALSEAYSSIIGSLALLKSAVGMFCILAVAIINIPVILELTAFVMSFKLSCAVAELLGEEKQSQLIESIASTFTVINITVIFESVIFIISSAIILSLRTNI